LGVIPVLDNIQEKNYNGVLVGVPTFGMVSVNFMVSEKLMGMPIFTSPAYMTVIGKPVDVARNEIAFTAMDGNYGYVLFRDDDVMIAPDAMIKLQGRLSKKQKGDPGNVAETIVGGIVYSKKKPPVPMIMRLGVPGGFEDWNFGDLVEADSIGMGCTLVPVGVFRKVAEDIKEFQCVNDGCSVGWSITHGPDINKCPTCGGALVPIMFKTVKVERGFANRPTTMTEDTYFCLLAAKAGVKVYADCSVQCQHECNKTGTLFYYHEGYGVPVWEDENGVDFLPRLDQVLGRDEIEDKSKKKEKEKKDKKIRFNIGSDTFHKKGYINIDLNTKCDFKCDVKNLRPAIAKYGEADEIRASHILEHIEHQHVTHTVRNWVKALKPGGKLYIEVPDALSAMKRLIDVDEKNGSAKEYHLNEWVVFGEQNHPGMIHQTAITKNKIERILKSCSGMIDKYDIEIKQDVKFPNGLLYDAIKVYVWKKKAKKEAKRV